MKTSYFHKLDVFGHEITLNYERKANKHYTKVGGVVSLIAGLMLTGYMLELFVSLVNYSPCNLYRYATTTDFSED